MATSAKIDAINNILAPVLFQVIGSTPESIAEAIMKANIEGNVSIGSQLCAVAILAAAVNKATLESFIAKPELAAIRPIVTNHFSISGKTNMTGLSLLGHCLLTSEVATAVKFAAEFRRKLGQSNIWAAGLDSGSLGEKQKKILLEKQKLVSLKSATLFGCGFFKYMGIDERPMTNEESVFWGKQIKTDMSRQARGNRSDTITGSTSGATFNPVNTGAQSTFVPSEQANTQMYGATQVVQTSSAAEAGNVTVRMANGSVDSVSKKAYDYYMAINNNDLGKLTQSVANRGGKSFSDIYSRASDQDPERRGFAGSVIGS